MSYVTKVYKYTAFFPQSCPASLPTTRSAASRRPNSLTSLTRGCLLDLLLLALPPSCEEEKEDGENEEEDDDDIMVKRKMRTVIILMKKMDARKIDIG